MSCQSFYVYLMSIVLTKYCFYQLPMFCMLLSPQHLKCYDFHVSATWCFIQALCKCSISFLMAATPSFWHNVYASAVSEKKHHLAEVVRGIILTKKESPTQLPWHQAYSLSAYLTSRPGSAAHWLNCHDKEPQSTWMQSPSKQLPEEKEVTTNKISFEWRGSRPCDSSLYVWHVC